MLLDDGGCKLTSLCESLTHDKQSENQISVEQWWNGD